MESTGKVKSISVVVGAYATNEEGDSAKWLAFEVTEAFIKELEGLQGICQQHSLSKVYKLADADWGPREVEMELRLQKTELVVFSAGSIMFTDYPKNSSYEVESRSFDLETLKTRFAEAAPDSVVFLSDDTSVRESYEEEFGTADDTEEQAG